MNNNKKRNTIFFLVFVLGMMAAIPHGEAIDNACRYASVFDYENKTIFFVNNQMSDVLMKINNGSQNPLEAKLQAMEKSQTVAPGKTAEIVVSINEHLLISPVSDLGTEDGVAVFCEFK